MSTLKKLSLLLMIIAAANCGLAKEAPAFGGLQRDAQGRLNSESYFSPQSAEKERNDMKDAVQKTDPNTVTSNFNDIANAPAPGPDNAYASYKMKKEVEKTANTTTPKSLLPLTAPVKNNDDKKIQANQTAQNTSSNTTDGSAASATTPPACSPNTKASGETLVPVASCPQDINSDDKCHSGFCVSNAAGDIIYYYDKYGYFLGKKIKSGDKVTYFDGDDNIVDKIPEKKTEKTTI